MATDSDRLIKVAFIITDLDTGGAEMMLLKMLERLDARFAPHVISLTSMGEVGLNIQALSIPVESLGMGPRVPNPLAFFRLVHQLKKLNPDVVHTWMYHADLLGGLAARLAGRSAVAWGIRQSNFGRKSKLLTRVVGGACATLSRRVPDRILCCSEKARLVHVGYGYAADKIIVLPNGFDLVRFKPDAWAREKMRAELGVRDDTLLVGLIGRYDPEKNHAGFFEAAGRLHRRIPTAHFVLAGNEIDERNHKLMQLVEAAGVRHVTHLLGLRSDIPQLMAALDVLASSSYGEAFPNVLGEAMACGVPCAVTDVGDSAYIVSDTGRVIKSGDMPGLAKALEELLGLPPAVRTALSERARARVAEHFEIGQVVKRYEAFYEELAAIGGRSINKLRLGRCSPNGATQV